MISGTKGQHLEKKKEVCNYEDDISAKKEIQSQSTWFPQKNENFKRQEGTFQKKGKRKKKIICVMQDCAKSHKMCGFFFSYGEKIIENERKFSETGKESGISEGLQVWKIKSEQIPGDGADGRGRRCEPLWVFCQQEGWEQCCAS